MEPTNENVNTANIVLRTSENPVKSYGLAVSAKANESVRNYEPSDKSFAVPLQQRIVSNLLNHDGSMTHSRRNEEEKSMNSLLRQPMLSSRPARSGDLVCDEDLLLEDSNLSREPLIEEHKDDAIDQRRLIGRLFSSRPNRPIHADVMDYFIANEHVYNISPNIFEANRQPELSWKMRALLLDWMIEVSCEFKLQRETFYLALNYLDRYVDKVRFVDKKDYQLIGASAIYIACKIEEIYTPRLNFFVLATDNGYSEDEILNMEREILIKLEWNLTPASIESWMKMCLLKWDKF